MTCVLQGACVCAHWHVHAGLSAWQQTECTASSCMPAHEHLHSRPGMPVLTVMKTRNACS